MKFKRSYDGKEVNVIDYLSGEKASVVDTSKLNEAGIKVRFDGSKWNIDLDSFDDNAHDEVELPSTFESEEEKPYVVYPTTCDEQIMLLTSEQLADTFDVELNFDDLKKINLFN